MDIIQFINACVNFILDSVHCMCTYMHLHMRLSSIYTGMRQTYIFALSSIRASGLHRPGSKFTVRWTCDEYYLRFLVETSSSSGGVSTHRYFALTFWERVKKKKKERRENVNFIPYSYTKIASCEQYTLLSFRSFAEIYALNSRDSKYAEIDSSDNFVKFT